MVEMVENKTINKVISEFNFRELKGELRAMRWTLVLCKEIYSPLLLPRASLFSSNFTPMSEAN